MQTNFKNLEIGKFPVMPNVPDCLKCVNKLCTTHHWMSVFYLMESCRLDIVSWSWKFTWKTKLLLNFNKFVLGKTLRNICSRLTLCYERRRLVQTVLGNRFPPVSFSSRLVPKLQWLLLSSGGGVTTCLFWRKGERLEVTVKKGGYGLESRSLSGSLSWEFLSCADRPRLISLSFTMTEKEGQQTQERGGMRQALNFVKHLHNRGSDSYHMEDKNGQEMKRKWWMRGEHVRQEVSDDEEEWGRKDWRKEVSPPGGRTVLLSHKWEFNN